MMSGSRNEPPISISSPRDTIVSRPSASAFSASTSAPALLLTASAASAPVSRTSQPEIWSSRSPRRPVSTSYSRVEGSRIAAAAAAIAASGNGARPRLVCSTVPVRLKTRRCDGTASGERARRRCRRRCRPPRPRPRPAARRAANAVLHGVDAQARARIARSGRRPPRIEEPRRPRAARRGLGVVLRSSDGGAHQARPAHARLSRRASRRTRG